LAGKCQPLRNFAALAIAPNMLRAAVESSTMNREQALLIWHRNGTIMVLSVEVTHADHDHPQGNTR
jgi:hypothetical protein